MFPSHDPEVTNKSFYHYKTVNDDTQEEKYYFTLKDVMEDYPLSRATLNNWLMKPDKPPKKYPNVRLMRDYKHRLVVDYNLPEDVVLNSL